MMSLDPRIEAILEAPDPLGRLRSLVRTLQIQGLDQAAILEMFEQARQNLRETEEDVILEAMDFLVGWCSPHMSLRSEKHP